MGSGYVFVLFFYFLFGSCTQKLLNPLRGGHYVPTSQGSDKIYIHGDVNYLEPGKSLTVRAIENCKILKSMKQDGAFMILAKGKFNTAYYSLENSFVQAGDSIKKGQEIGMLFHKDSVLFNSLQIAVEKNGVFIRPKW